MKYDWLIVGAGFTGSVLAERIASQSGKRVLLIDRRGHVGGNAYDTLDEHGVLVHTYGPHIFHTNSKTVWDYLSQFTEWRPYEHRVLGSIEGKQVPLPFNLHSLHALFPASKAAHLEALLVGAFGEGTNVPILSMRQHSNPDVATLAEYVYRNVFANYTMKQWDMSPEELGPEVTGRVPMRVGRDDRYFQDRYQAMPKDGFTQIFRRMLAHPNITVELNCDYSELGSAYEFDRIAYTGPIDEFFLRCYGELSYRSLVFENYFEACEISQAVAVINYPNDHAYTRITEFKHLTGQVIEGTSLMREYPTPYIMGHNEPYYPVPSESNAERYQRYASEAARQKKVLFAGRLGNYKYYNMDQAVAIALKMSAQIIREME